MMREARTWSWLLAGLLALGCNSGSGSSERSPPVGPSAEGSRYLLASEPAGARGVADTRKEAKDGEAIVVVGCIGGDEHPWVEGRATFQIIDTSLKSCKDVEGDNCPTPWDYCCTPREELLAMLATVKVVDEQGQPVATDARQLLGLKELQTIVVRGKAKRDDKGNLTILADALFIRP
jgi:hypothetical protein